MWLGLSIATAVLVGVSLLLLALPIRFDVEVHGDTGRPVRVRLHALLGLLTPELSASREHRHARRSSRRSGARAARRALAFVRSHGAVHRVVRYLERLVRSLRVRELSMVARIGLDDPADTGELSALLTPLALWAAEQHQELVIAPSFDGPALEVRGHLSVAVVPLEILAVTMAFVASPTMVRAAVSAWRAP